MPETSVPTIEPRCDWVSSFNASGKLDYVVGNFYGFVQTNLIWFALIGILALAITIGFAVRRKVVPFVILTLVTIIFLAPVVQTITGIGGVGPCST
jgi:hypothetical protein